MNALEPAALAPDSAVAPVRIRGCIADGRSARARTARRRRLIALGVPVTISAGWLAYVTVAGQWSRVGNHWEAAVTMVVGSFVAGSTPQGGGAVAFPAFTKGLGIDTEVARSFSLFIQTVGMGAAAATIVIMRRRVDWLAIGVALPAACAGFLAGYVWLSDAGGAFRPATLPAPYVKITFSLIVGAMAMIVYLTQRVTIREVVVERPATNVRVVGLFVVAGVVGGVASALTGSGADVLVYVCVALLLGIDPRVGVPTSVIVMAGVSVLGLLTLGIADGQLLTTLTPDGEFVVGVGGRALAPLPASRFDLFGLWLAALPVVAWGAPAGALVAAKLRTRQLVAFVAALAALEIVTTLALVAELRSDLRLVAYALGLGALVVVGLRRLVTARRALFGLPDLDPDRSLTRADLEVSGELGGRP